MLSTTNQLDAYKSLIAAGGLKTPASATKATAAATSATSLSTTLAAMILSTVTYPSSVTSSITAFKGWINSLAGMATNASNYAALMTKYADPSVLIQLSTGWDVYCRASDLPASDMPISAAIGDDTEPSALVAALAALTTTGLSSAMSDINTTLSTTTTGLSTAQITALTSAVTAFTSLMANVTTAHSALTTRYTAAQKSASEAEDAFSNAVSVALINSSVSSTAVGSAVSAITPAAVLAILKKGAS